MWSTATEKLVRLVERQSGEQYSASEAQQLIQQGADIRTPVRNGPMIDWTIREMDRYQQAGSWKAQNCGQLVQVLTNHASSLLAHSVLSNNGGDLTEITQLSQLHAKCYQSERFGSLGLLGELLKQEKIPIRFEIVQFLIDNYGDERLALVSTDDQGQTCLSLSKSNQKCPAEVQQCLQKTFDKILNQIPLKYPQINANTVIEWIHLGANPEAVDEKGNTVLCNAIIAKNQQLVRKLVDFGCNTAHKNKDNLTPLQIAENATPRNPQLETILQSQNINMKLKQLIETKKNLLTFNEVRALLEEGAKINAPMANGSTPLHLLIANVGTPELVTAFVNDFHADLTTMDIHGHRPVEACILLDKAPFNVLRAFLQLAKISTDTYYNTKLNTSILQFAQEQKRPDAVVKIIQDALNLRLWNLVSQTNTKDEHNRRLTSELHQLLVYGAELEHKHSDKDYQGWAILHLACKTSTRNFVQYLIEQEKADQLSTNDNGDTPLSIATEHGHLPIVQYLHRSLNAQLNVFNKKRQTPLHLATDNHHLLLVRYLVLWGADHQAKNAANQTPLDLARINVSKNRKDETADNAIIAFLTQLICPEKDPADKQTEASTKPNEDLDTCELIRPIPVPPIKQTSLGDEEQLGQQKKNFLTNTANADLISAAREGLLDVATTAIGSGANICYEKNGQNAYRIAHQAMAEYHAQMVLYQSRLAVSQDYQRKMIACQQIKEVIQQTAYNRLLRGIDSSDAYHVQAFHQAGAPLTVDLLSYSCAKSDNVQIIDYLINTGGVMFQAMFDYSTDDSPYRIARKNNFNKVASYLKYRLSMECAKAVEKNDTEYVRKLVRAGASVDMDGTNNLRVALAHQNAELMEILCKNGAKMPIDWRQSTTITVPENALKEMKSEIVLSINRSLVNRRLRLAAAQGDLTTLTRCLHLSADINSENCYGSTALLRSIQHGNYFAIVHALVSRGASILHSNEDEPMSLIVLAKKRNYTQIANYLSQELNTQFLRTIQNNDLKSATKFEGLGPDFNSQDEQKRTALHHAVRYHGIELVKWLCASGSTPTVADSDGNYPITEATEKGDYAVVEFFATKHPVTKQQKNKVGLTALQIAEKQGFQRIAYFLKTGQPAPDSMGDDKSKPTAPRHTREQLIKAAKNGNINTLKEFIDDHYESNGEKRQICFQLIHIAKEAKQYEVVHLLQPYYDNQLKAELPSNIESGGVVRLNEHYKKMLLGFLTGLGQVIADSPVLLDPADPNTYKQLFSHLTTNQKKRSDEIHQVSSEHDAKKLSDEDMTNINKKLTSIDKELSQLKAAKEGLSKDIEETSDQLKQQKELTAIQRADLFKQRDEHRKQLAVYECSLFLYELQQESTLIRQKTVNFIRTSPNMYLFFRTIENLLQSLFHGALAARSGLLSTKAVDSGPSSLIPFSEVISLAVKSTVSAVVSKLNDREQKKEYSNISTLGNIEELGRLATDTASLLTLYYREPIESIDASGKIKGSNIFNEKIRWLKEQLIDVGPEEKLPIVIVAEYITAWVMEALKKGKEPLDHCEPIAQQLWFHVAKTNCVEGNNMTKLTDFLGSTAGQQKIPKRSDDGNIVHVQLRYLIGCVSVVTGEGQIHQYQGTKDSSKIDLSNLELFGYVYVDPFLNSTQSWDAITKGRNLIAAPRRVDETILNKLKEIEEYVQNFQDHGAQKRQSLIKEETARQVAEVLREQKVFVDPKDVKQILNQSRQEIGIDVDKLRETIQEKILYYQTSLDATSEKLQQQVAQATETLRKDNEKNYQNVLDKFNEQTSRMEKKLERQMTEGLQRIEKQLQEQCDEMRKTIQTAQTEVSEALKSTNQAVAASEKSAQRAEQTRASAMKLVQSMEQQRNDFQVVLRQCQTNVEQTITEQKASCAQAIIAIQTKVQQDFERLKISAEQAAINAKESANASKELAQSTREIQKDTRRQTDLQREEMNQTTSQLKEFTKQNVRLADQAEEAKKQAIAAHKRVEEIARKS